MTFGYEFFIIFVMFLNIDQYREVSIQFVLPFILIVVIAIICNIVTIAYECFFGQKPSDIEKFLHLLNNVIKIRHFCLILSLFLFFDDAILSMQLRDNVHTRSRF
ncbi:hypothetical protein ACJX0J_034284, partial [Zea mays]